MEKCECGNASGTVYPSALKTRPTRPGNRAGQSIFVATNVKRLADSVSPPPGVPPVPGVTAVSAISPVPGAWRGRTDPRPGRAWFERDAQPAVPPAQSGVVPLRSPVHARAASPVINPHTPGVDPHTIPAPGERIGQLVTERPIGQYDGGAPIDRDPPRVDAHGYNLARNGLMPPVPPRAWPTRAGQRAAGHQGDQGCEGRGPDAS